MLGLLAQVGSRKLLRTIDGGGSYLSSSDPRVHFGLGDATRIDRLEIRWPSGKVEMKIRHPGESNDRVDRRTIRPLDRCSPSTKCARALAVRTVSAFAPRKHGFASSLALITYAVGYFGLAEDALSAER